jgi:ABC-type sugar transport system substrate-binding protein
VKLSNEEVAALADALVKKADACLTTAVDARTVAEKIARTQAALTLLQRSEAVRASGGA